MSALGIAFSQAGNSKIGFVDVDSVTSALPEYQAKVKIYESYVAQFQKQRENKEKELRDKYEALIREQDDLIPEVIQERQEELQKLQISLEEFMRKSQASVSQKEQELIGPILVQVQKGIDDVAKEMGYDFIVQKEAFLFASGTHDLTGAVIKKILASGSTGQK